VPQLLRYRVPPNITHSLNRALTELIFFPKQTHIKTKLVHKIDPINNYRFLSEYYSVVDHLKKHFIPLCSAMSVEDSFRINSFTSASTEPEAKPLYYTKTQEILDGARILHQGISSTRRYAGLRKSLLSEMPSCCEASEV
jgi:hypothetical protein